MSVSIVSPDPKVAIAVLKCRLLSSGSSKVLPLPRSGTPWNKNSSAIKGSEEGGYLAKILSVLNGGTDAI